MGIALKHLKKSPKQILAKTHKYGPFLCQKNFLNKNKQIKSCVYKIFTDKNLYKKKKKSFQLKKITFTCFDHSLFRQIFFQCFRQRPISVQTHSRQRKIRCLDTFQKDIANLLKKLFFLENFDLNAFKSKLNHSLKQNFSDPSPRHDPPVTQHYL